MLMREIILAAAHFLQLEDTIIAVQDEMEDGDVDAELLLRCTNLVISEIASEYYPLKEKVTLEANGNGEIYYTDFPRSLFDIFKAVNASGISVPFTRYHDHIIVPAAGEYEITYSYAPESLWFDEEVPFPAKISDRILAYGAVCEYCLISGMNEEAATWDKRYKDALSSVTFPYGEKRVKRRGWLL